MYKQVVRSVLADSHKVTVDTKKMLKKLRQDNKISEHEHDQCLGQVRCVVPLAPQVLPTLKLIIE
jgi:hypothetical protein